MLATALNRRSNGVLFWLCVFFRFRFCFWIFWLCDVWSDIQIANSWNEKLDFYSFAWWPWERRNKKIKLNEKKKRIVNNHFSLDVFSSILEVRAHRQHANRFAVWIWMKYEKKEIYRIIIYANLISFINKWRACTGHTYLYSWSIFIFRLN